MAEQSQSMFAQPPPPPPTPILSEPMQARRCHPFGALPIELQHLPASVALGRHCRALCHAFRDYDDELLRSIHFCAHAPPAAIVARTRRCTSLLRINLSGGRLEDDVLCELLSVPSIRASQPTIDVSHCPMLTRRSLSALLASGSDWLASGNWLMHSPHPKLSPEDAIRWQLLAMRSAPPGSDNVPYHVFASSARTHESIKFCYLFANPLQWENADATSGACVERDLIRFRRHLFVSCRDLFGSRAARLEVEPMITGAHERTYVVVAQDADPSLEALHLSDLVSSGAEGTRYLWRLSLVAEGSMRGCWVTDEVRGEMAVNWDEVEEGALPGAWEVV